MTETTKVARRGAFIVIEGLDRSGKTTQVELLVERLRSEGTDVKGIKFPDRTTPIGRMLDSYLRSESELDDRAVHLLFSANRWELASTIEQTLKAGTTLVCDRYAFSGIAFTASKPNAPEYTWCRAPDVGLPAPDITLYLDVSLEAARARGGFGAERYEREDVQKRVRDAFARIGEEMGEGLLAEGAWASIDADMEREKVAEIVWDWVLPLSKGTERPLRRLWEEKVDTERINQLYI